VDANHKAVVSAERSYEAQQKGFEYGTVTVVDVLNASETLYEARRDYRQAYYDLMVQGLTLSQVAGEFSSEKVSEINGWLDASAQSN
jgi:outer membrane protein